ncbi:hypothetical protein BH09BAC1_BH09BAC1_02670 [soil metagenome]
MGSTDHQITPLVSQISYTDAPRDAKTIWDQQIADYGRMTNMKRTLAHSPIALRSYMEWYPLKNEIAAVIGERSAILFAHAISTETDCLICSTFFRKILIQWGENPNALMLNQQEQLLVDLGRAIAINFNKVPPALIFPFKQKYGEAFVVNLVAFAGIMIATNLFNNVLQLDLDDYLGEFKHPN